MKEVVVEFLGDFRDREVRLELMVPHICADSRPCM